MAEIRFECHGISLFLFVKLAIISKQLVFVAFSTFAAMFPAIGVIPFVAGKVRTGYISATSGTFAMTVCIHRTIAGLFASIFMILDFIVPFGRTTTLLPEHFVIILPGLLFSVVLVAMIGLIMVAILILLMENFRLTILWILHRCV